MSFFDSAVLLNIESDPGVTALGLAEAMKYEGEPVYDAHRRVSFAIARLRKQGLIEDVERCRHCNRALTRNNRNVPLRAKAK